MNKVIEEGKESLSQVTGWLVLLASGASKAAPEVEAAIGSSLDILVNTFENIREAATNAGLLLAPIWIGLPARVRAFFNRD